MPRLGAALSGAKWHEYDHLQRSIAAFPRPAAFVAMLRDAGLEPRAPVFFAAGSVALYVADVPATPPPGESADAPSAP